MAIEENCGLHDLRDIRYVTMICNYQLVREQKALELLCDTLRVLKVSNEAGEKDVLTALRLIDDLRQIRNMMLHEGLMLDFLHMQLCTVYHREQTDEIIEIIEKLYDLWGVYNQLIKDVTKLYTEQDIHQWIKTIAPRLQAAVNDFKRINTEFADIYIKIAELEEKTCRRS